MHCITVVCLMLNINQSVNKPILVVGWKEDLRGKERQCLGKFLKGYKMPKRSFLDFWIDDQKSKKP